jgi:hypothetical protein
VFRAARAALRFFRRDPAQIELELPSAVPFRERLSAAGLGPDWVVTITDNRATMVSFRGQSVRVHRSYTDAPDEVVLAIARFVTAPRRSDRREASRVILRHAPQESSADAVPIRSRDRTHPADEPFVQRLKAAHVTYNRELFDGALKPISIRVSRRMRRKLGHYSPAVNGLPAEIAIGRRHIRGDPLGLGAAHAAARDGTSMAGRARLPARARPSVPSDGSYGGCRSPCREAGERRSGSGGCHPAYRERQIMTRGTLENSSVQAFTPGRVRGGAQPS